MHTAQAAVFTPATRAFDVREYPVAQPGPGHVGLSLRYSGICGTDVHIAEGKLGPMPFPLILGHEFIGRIEALGADAVTDALGRPVVVGDLALACVAVPCGKCFNCLRGETASCLAFGVTYAKPVEEAPHFHGGFAGYQEIQWRNIVRIPDGLDPKAVAAFPCGGPTILRACAYGGGLEKDELVVVQGNGSLGLFATAYAKAKGCRTVCIGSSANARRLEATRAFGPDVFIDFRSTDADGVRKRVREEAEAAGRGDGADVCIETSGDPAAFPLGLSLLRTRGRYFVPGQYSDRGEIAIPPHTITFRALQIIGSGQYTLDDIRAYLDFLAEHPALQPRFASVLSCYAVADVQTAMADAAAGRAIKAVFARE